MKTAHPSLCPGHSLTETITLHMALNPYTTFCNNNTFHPKKKKEK
uniref:Uncharacterized protein n=1 Tax=Anguilla anguilla TaxID=7936 RepID=A0A0E9W1J5_ANGAN